MRWRRPRSPPDGPLTTIRQLTAAGSVFLLERRLSGQRGRRAVRRHRRSHGRSQPARDRLLRGHQQELRGRKQLRQDPQQRGEFAPGQSTYTFNVTIHDQGINGPMRTRARVPLWRPPAAPGHAQPGDNRPPSERPAERQEPGEPARVPAGPDRRRSAAVRQLVRLRRAVAPAGAALGSTRTAIPPGHRRCTRSPTRPVREPTGSGCGTSRAATLASTVEKYLADAELAQPNTTMALSTYSLVHGACEAPRRSRTASRTG